MTLAPGRRAVATPGEQPAGDSPEGSGPRELIASKGAKLEHGVRLTRVEVAPSRPFDSHALRWPHFAPCVTSGWPRAFAQPRDDASNCRVENASEAQSRRTAARPERITVSALLTPKIHARRGRCSKFPLARRESRR